MSEAAATRSPLVGVVMGSDSDWPVMEAAAERARRVRRPVRGRRRVGAPDAARDDRRTATSAAGRGLRVIIAGAGGAAHLPGMLASVTPLPVIGVPVPLREPRRDGLAAVDRADAGRRTGRHRVGRRCAQRRAAGRTHPRRVRPTRCAARMADVPGRARRHGARRRASRCDAHAASPAPASAS